LKNLIDPTRQPEGFAWATFGLRLENARLRFPLHGVFNAPPEKPHGNDAPPLRTPVAPRLNYQTSTKKH